MEACEDPTSRILLVGLITSQLHNADCPACRLLFCVSNFSHAEDFRKDRSLAFLHVCQGLSLEASSSAAGGGNHALLAYYSHKHGEGLRDFFGTPSIRLFQVIPLEAGMHFDLPRHSDTFAVPISSRPGTPEANVSDDRPSLSVGGRLVGETVDFSLCVSWMDWCRTQHGKFCGGSQHIFPQSVKLRLIDCDDVKLVDHLQGTEYVALSYVWGDTDREPLDKDAISSGILPKSIPRVIENAIEVTRNLNIRYLWVDRYCINQDDDVERDLQIRAMDAVYQNATLTIIAAAGKDSSHGLPGVGTTPRRLQPRARLGRELFAAARLTYNWEILDSVWLTRAWTFQEGILSRRRLIFDDSFVFFECCSMSCSEALDIPMRNFEFQHMQRTGEPNAKLDTHRVFPAGGVGEDEADLWDRIEEYSTRELRYGRDALRAMQGIFRHFKKFPRSIYEFEGLPFPSQRCVGNAYELMELLTWYHPNPVKRREEFPSWSWLGWDGKVQRPFVFGHHLREATRLSVCLQLSSGEIIGWRKFHETFLSKGRPLATKLSYLMIEAWTSKVEIGSGEEHGFTLPLRRSVYLEKRDPSRRCDFRAIFDDKELYNATKEGPYYADVVFPFCETETDNRQRVGILVKEQVGGVYERIGICFHQRLPRLTFKGTSQKSGGREESREPYELKVFRLR